MKIEYNQMDLLGTSKFNFVQNRLPGPKTYNKALITHKLLKKGIDSEKKFLEKGGLSKDQYDFFNYKIDQRRQVTKQIINGMPEKELSGKNPLYGISEESISAEGTKKLMVLLVDFENRPFKTSADFFKKLLFSNGDNYSLRDYFAEVSGGKLEVQGEVIDWLTLGEYEQYLVAKSEYGKKWMEPDCQKIVADAINLANETNVLSKFADKSFDALMVIGSGNGANRTMVNEDLDPHRGPLGQELNLAGNIFDHYMMINELPAYDLGGFCHEFAHELGIPDLYSEDGHSMVVGRWCLMGAGSYNNKGRTPAHLSAWCKMKLGWVETISIRGKPSFYEITAVNGKIKGKIGIVYKLDIPNSNGREYFLVENRQQNGFDRDLPCNGLLIWHVNEYGFFKGSPNFLGLNFSLTLKQADGRNELESRLIYREFFNRIDGSLGGDWGDVYPGITSNRSFNTKSNPNSNSYKGQKSGIVIDSISNSSEIMSALMGYGSFSHEVPAFVLPSLDLSYLQSKEKNTVSLDFLSNQSFVSNIDSLFNELIESLNSKGDLEFALESSILENGDIDLFEKIYKKGFDDGFAAYQKKL